MTRVLWLLLLSLELSSCYSLNQAYWFNNAFNSRQSIQEALLRSDLASEDRQKLQLSRAVLKFAVQQGLNAGDSYQHFIPAGPGTVSHLLQAAYPDRLELLTWWFPIVGQVPYLGFFDKNDRDRRALELQNEKYDVSISTVGAFSSLGWFSDPIYASMLRHSDEDFVQTLLHELVHRSFWSRGSAGFNENLAEFVSVKLTEVFLEEQHMESALHEFRLYRQDREKLRLWIIDLKNALDSLYSRSDLLITDKLQKKSQVIEDFRQNLFPKLQTKDGMAAQHRKWNNASILGAALYAPDTARFERALSCLPVKTMHFFLEALKEVEQAYSKAEDSMDSLCGQGRSS